MILDSPPDPPKGIPLCQLIRHERVCSYASLILTLAILPAAFFIILVIGGTRGDPGWICCAAPFLGAVFLYGLRLMARYTPEITEMALDEQLRRYGDVKEMTVRVTAELADLSGAWTWGGWAPTGVGGWPDCWVVTDCWLIRVKYRSLQFVPLDDLLWVHKRISVRTGLLWRDWFSHYLCVVTERGLDQKIPGRYPKELDWILKQIIARCPEGLYGFHGEALDLLRQGKPAMRAEVERRRGKWESLSEDEREDWLEDALDDATECVQRVEAG